MPSLAHYMTQYDHEHESGWNKFLHGVGIPMIFAGIIFLLFTKWILGAGFFLGGWVFLFLGHRIEGNHPAFFQKRSMDVPNGHAPQADLGRYSAK